MDSPSETSPLQGKPQCEPYVLSQFNSVVMGLAPIPEDRPLPAPFSLPDINLSPENYGPDQFHGTTPEPVANPNPERMPPSQSEPLDPVTRSSSPTPDSTGPEPSLDSSAPLVAPCLPLDPQGPTPVLPPESVTQKSIISTLPDGRTDVLPHFAHVRDPVNRWIYGGDPAFGPPDSPLWQELSSVLKARRSVFAYTMQDISDARFTGEPFTVELTSTKPIITRPRMKSPLERGVLWDKALELWNYNLIEPASAHCQTICETTCPAKKDVHGLWTERRFCIDYVPVNAVTVPDRYTLHRPEVLFEVIGGSPGDRMIYSKLDLRAGYHQIPVAMADRDKLAFRWGNQVWRFTRMPFGARNAPAKFQRVMDGIINDNNLGAFAVCFVDDVLIFSKNPADHIRHIAAVLDAIAAAGLLVHPEKSTFAAASVDYLGHYVSAYGLTPQEAKVLAIRKMRLPTSQTELRAQLGFFNYYRCYVVDFAAMAKPLTRLTGKNTPFEWTDECTRAINQLKSALCTEGLALRRLDPTREVKVYTDWSNLGISGVVSQSGDEDPAHEYLVACVSRSLNVHESLYSAYEGEMLAAVWAIKTLRSVIHGLPFKLVTDHRSLTFLMRSRELVGKYARWALSLQDYDFTIVHRPGVTHANADVPSRFPLPHTTDVTGARMDEDATPPTAPASCLPPTQATPLPPLPSVIDNWSAAQDDLGPFQRFDYPQTLPITTPTEDPCGEYCFTLHGLLDCDEGRATFGDTALEEDVTSEYDVWVNCAGATLRSNLVHPPLPLHMTQEHVISISNQLVAHQFFGIPAPQLTVLELFGGMCAGLEMLLQAGFTVHRYLYSDINPKARTLAEHRVQSLALLYPHQFHPSACEHMFSIPQDVRRMTLPDLLDMGLPNDCQWMVVAGWECQDLSTAGNGAGLEGQHSSTFFDLVRVLSTIQDLMPHRLPGYLLENVTAHMNHKHAQVRRDAAIIHSVIGLPCDLDAAQVGSRAHRLRSYWTNLVATEHLTAVFTHVKRLPNLLVDDILDEGRWAQPSTHDPPAPFYPCRAAAGTSKPRQHDYMHALPTLVSYVGSYAYRDGGKGLVWDSKKQVWEEPNCEERERALGYRTGDTAAPGLSAQDRHEALGRCMDANALSAIIGVAGAVHRWFHSPDRGGIKAALATAAAQGEDLPFDSASSHCCLTAQSEYPTDYPLPPIITDPDPFLQTEESGDEPFDCDSDLEILDANPPAATAPAPPGPPPPARPLGDIWADTHAMRFLQGQEEDPHMTRAERKRILQRAKNYIWKDNQVWRVQPGQANKQVPAPDTRDALVLTTHQSNGHFGYKRTLSQLRQGFYWNGMEDQVAKVVALCVLCDRVRANFTVRPAELESLSIEGLFYRVGIDLFGPLPRSHGFCYVMVMVEYFTKHLELIPLPAKESVHTARAFLDNFLARFGAPAEVVTDRGSEFQGAFQKLLTDCCIDHRTTSSDHPQADGLAERAVQTVKRALRKYCEGSDGSNWYEFLPWIALGYRTSKQASSRMTPYFMLYGREAVIPPAIRERWSEADLNLDEASQERAADLVLKRAAMLRRHMPLAFENLKVAQHRDRLTYARMRGGGFRPSLRVFKVGDFVYLKQKALTTLHISTRSVVLRVKEVRPSGVLILQGRCGRLFSTNVRHCAPCHLSGIDPTLYPELARPGPHMECELCHHTDDDRLMLLCDSCGLGWHTTCLGLGEEIPEGLWICPRCQDAGITPLTVHDNRQQTGLYEPPSHLGIPD